VCYFKNMIHENVCGIIEVEHYNYIPVQNCLKRRKSHLHIRKIKHIRTQPNFENSCVWVL
jgi:hypothetical protein